MTSPWGHIDGAVLALWPGLGKTPLDPSDGINWFSCSRDRGSGEARQGPLCGSQFPAQGSAPSGGSTAGDKASQSLLLLGSSQGPVDNVWGWGKQLSSLHTRWAPESGAGSKGPEPWGPSS